LKKDINENKDKGSVEIGLLTLRFVKMIYK
jgi:hypothetical protein